jgi:hypothetical protein
MVSVLFNDHLACFITGLQLPIDLTPLITYIETKFGDTICIGHSGIDVNSKELLDILQRCNSSSETDACNDIWKCDPGVAWSFKSGNFRVIYVVEGHSGIAVASHGYILFNITHEGNVTETDWVSFNEKKLPRYFAVSGADGRSSH